jgi:pyruvate dehydrogenase E2 component (dihydrolipoamide acetyltransferase)
MHEIILPKLGMAMTEGMISEWEKKVGESVKKGEVLFTMESDKALIDVKAECNGILKEILVKNNETVKAGTVVGIIEPIENE